MDAVVKWERKRKVAEASKKTVKQFLINWGCASDGGSSGSNMAVRDEGYALSILLGIDLNGQAKIRSGNISN